MNELAKDYFDFARGFSIGFDDVFRNVKRNTQSYPPYNIIKEDETNYRIELALAGFKRDEITVTLKKNQLTVSTDSVRAEDVEPIKSKDYIHRGISRKSITRTFLLADNVVVTGSDYEDGVLSIHLERVVPEEEQPKLIPIGTKTAQQLLTEEEKNVDTSNESNSDTPSSTKGNR